MASSSYAIYDRPKQEWTIEIIGKQVHRNNEQDTTIFTNQIQNLIDSKHIGKIHFLINEQNRQIAPIASLHKKLLLNNGESILQSEFTEYTESKDSNFNSKMNWFCFDEFWTLYPKMYWIKNTIMLIDEKEQTLNNDEFKIKFNELYYASLEELSRALSDNNDQQGNSDNNNNNSNKPRLSINIHNPNNNTNTNNIHGTVQQT